MLTLYCLLVMSLLSFFFVSSACNMSLSVAGFKISCLGLSSAVGVSYALVDFICFRFCQMILELFGFVVWCLSLIPEKYQPLCFQYLLCPVFSCLLGILIIHLLDPWYFPNTLCVLLTHPSPHTCKFFFLYF